VFWNCDRNHPVDYAPEPIPPEPMDWDARLGEVKGLYKPGSTLTMTPSSIAIASTPRPLGRLALAPLAQGLTTLALVAASLTGLGFVAPPAAAVDDIQITYGDLEAPPISLEDLENFARTGIPSRDLQLLLTLLRVDEAKARALLTQELSLDVESLRQASDSFMGQFLWRLIATTFTVTDGAEASWKLMQDAVLTAAANGSITLIDVLRNIEATVLRIDSQRVMAIASQIRPEDIQVLSSIFLGR
jgi:hypothetical protein